MVNLIAVIVVGSSFASPAQGKPTKWIKLFDEKTLNGWTITGGTATYAVVNKTIVGTTAEGGPNTFLTTDREFGDFELEFEVKVDNRLNSGCQIRSRTTTKEDMAKFKLWGEGVFAGPQVEIESSPGQAGYIYGEGTELGWISKEPQSPDEAVNQHSFFKNDQWNKYNITAIGPQIRVTLNGKVITEMLNLPLYRRYSAGKIGLQVHSIGKGEGPYTVAWRSIRLREYR